MFHLVKGFIHTHVHLSRDSIYWAMSLKTLGISLVSVFVPAYLYRLGYSLELILIYFVIREVVEVIMVMPTSRLIISLGARTVFLLGCLLAIVNLCLLYALPGTGSFFAYAAIAEGLAISLFFLPYHFIFAKQIQKKTGGSRISFMDNLISITAAAGPFVGGAIASFVHIRVALGSAICFVVLAVVPLLYKNRTDYGEHKQSFKPWTNFSRLKGDLQSSAGFGVTEMAATVIWPLFIFLSVGTYVRLGAIISVSLLAVIFLVYLLGKNMQSGMKKVALYAGSYGSAGTHLARLAHLGVGYIALLNVLGELVHALFRIPWSYEFYLKARGRSGLTYIALMEFVMGIARLGFWLAVLSFAIFMSDTATFYAAFILGAFGSLLIPKIQSSKK